MKINKIPTNQNKAAENNLTVIMTDFQNINGTHKVYAEIEGTDVKNKQICKKEFDNSEHSESGESDLDSDVHTKSLLNLKNTDSAFYLYLKNNDEKLLQFNIPNRRNNNEELHHDDILNGRHDDRDESKTEFLNMVENSKTISLKLLATWEEDIINEKSVKSIKCLVDALHAALCTVSSDDVTYNYKVEGSAVFNGVVRICVLYLPEAFQHVLRLGNESHFDAHKCKRFVKVKGFLRSYLSDLVKMLQNITSVNVISILLKHLHKMLPYVHSFSSLRRPLLKVLITFWSTGAETVRVLSFICILKIAISQKDSLLETLMKNMYITYVENSKFVSPSSAPGINFMRQSLTEIYLIDSKLSYYCAFLYIRQLAIHLRNSVILKKKGNYQAVYNWQFINSLRFWAEVIPKMMGNSMLQHLLYPVVQIIIGTIKIIPTAQYYPLRFQCVKMLINISKCSCTFIPTIPFLLEILTHYDFNTSLKNAPVKPMSLIYVLRLSKSQLQTKCFKDSVIEIIYELILETAANDSHAAYFPDLYLPCIIQLKEFLKKCTVPNYCRKIKHLLDKIEENRKFIENERCKAMLDLKNPIGIAQWERKIQCQGTPINKFYESWFEIQRLKKLKLMQKENAGFPGSFADGLRQSDEKRDLETSVEMVNELATLNSTKNKKKSTASKAVGLLTNDFDVLTGAKYSDWD